MKKFKMKGHELPGPNQRRSPNKKDVTGMIMEGVDKKTAGFKEAAAGVGEAAKKAGERMKKVRENVPKASE